MAKPIINIPEIFDEYIKKGYWESITFSDLWDRNARDYPEKEAIVDSTTRLTWAQAKQWIDRIASGFLDLGIKRDEVVVLQLPPCAELALLMVACEKAGIVCLPVLRTLRHTEMEYILRYVDAAGVVIPWKFGDFDYYKMVDEIRPNLPKLRHVFVVGAQIPRGAISLKRMVEQPPARRYSQDYFKGKSFEAAEVALLRQTTGTTGFPKFPEALICALIYNGRMIMKDFKLNGDDTGIALSPTVGGPNAAIYFTAPLAGAKMVITDHFDAEEALKIIEREKVTYISAVPTMLEKMIGHPNFDNYDLSSVRLVFTTGAGLPYQTGKLTEGKIGSPVVQMFGSAESGGLAWTNMDLPPDERWSTVGMLVPGNEVKLINDVGNEVGKGQVGEVWGRGPTFTFGYYRDYQATRNAWTKDGWFNFGDMGKFDENGNLVIVGRKKDVIIRGGQNVYPVEVENMLALHPKISDVAVVGIPDAVMGERACAFVVVKVRQEFTFEEMIAFLKEKKIASYKLPERLEIIERLPLVGEQKVDKKMLRQIMDNKLKVAE